MRKAVIDQIMLWIVIFVSFVIIFYMVISYYKIIKVKERVDAMTNYAARMKALGRDDDNITLGLNNLRTDYFQEINSSSIICNQDITANNYQVLFQITVNNIDTISFDDKTINSYSSAFNEVDSSEISCSLTIIKG